jgi:hypothetical protein
MHKAQNWRGQYHFVPCVREIDASNKVRYSAPIQSSFASTLLRVLVEAAHTHSSSQPHQRDALRFLALFHMQRIVEYCKMDYADKKRDNGH